MPTAALEPRAHQTRLDHVTNLDIRTRLKVAPNPEKMRQARLRWYGHVMRRDEQSVVRTALNIDPADRRPRGRPKKRWLDRLNEDMRIVNIEPDDALDQAGSSLGFVVDSILRVYIYLQLLHVKMSSL